MRASDHKHAGVQAPSTVGILIFDNVEVLDFAGPYEFFTTASRVQRRDRPSSAESFSVCTIARTSAPVRARAGLLEGKMATTHWEDINDLRSMFPDVTVRAGLRWVDEGAVVTSAGISAGIDMSLHLVERTAGRELATNTARQMEFDWKENS